MKLGSETNSLMNHLYSRATVGQPEPVVGMGVTFLSWTDRDPGTIVEIHKDKAGQVIEFVARYDKAKRVDGNGMSEVQSYEFEPDPNGAHRRYRYRAGQWRQVRMGEKGRLVFADKSQSIRLGERDKYYDFSF